MSEKKYFSYFCDDVIRFLENINKNRPDSIFDDPFLALHKKIHDKYGASFQFNLFYQNDDGSFDLGMMTDAYKQEFEANSDWLRLGYHARKCYPDFPHLNATYESVCRDFDDIVGNIIRFAGEKTFSDSSITHWVSLSKQAAQALADKGVKSVSCTAGVKDDRPEAKCALSSDHINILLAQNEGVSKPSIAQLYINEVPGLPFLVNHNHLTPEQHKRFYGRIRFYRDPETGLFFNDFAGVTLNATPYEDIVGSLKALSEYEFVIPLMHEQYFYKDFYSYEPDYADKIELAFKTLLDLGYTHVPMYKLPMMQY